MFGLETQETSEKKRDRALLELMLHHEKLNRDIESLFKELNVCPEQLTTYIENPKNFPGKNWDKLQEEKQKLHDSLEKKLAELKQKQQPSPQKLPKNSASPANHWIFVR